MTPLNAAVGPTPTLTPRIATVVIDAFRAFATAAHVLDRRPDDYLLTATSSAASRLAGSRPDALLIGKPEVGSDLAYDLPNSPTRVAGANVTGRLVVHRTEAGAKGVLRSASSDIVLVAGFVNARATARWLRRLQGPQVTIEPMGHEATTPSIEDDLCAEYLESLLDGRSFDLEPHLPALREGPGRYFFGGDQWQYPREDFHMCLHLDRFDFAIRAEVLGDYARLTRC